MSAEARVKSVDELPEVFEETNRGVVLGAPGIEIGGRLEAVAEEEGAIVVETLRELEDADPDTPVVIRGFYAGLWSHVYTEGEGQDRLEAALDERLDGNAGLYLRTTPYRLEWLLSEERRQFDELVGGLGGWRVCAVSLGAETALDIARERIGKSPDLTDEQVLETEWSYEFDGFEGALRDDESFDAIFGGLSEYATHVPATMVAAHRHGTTGDWFAERDSALETLRGMLGDATTSQGQSEARGLFEGAREFVGTLREDGVLDTVLDSFREDGVTGTAWEAVDGLPSDIPDLPTDLAAVPVGAAAGAAGATLSPAIAAAGLIGYWAYATRKDAKNRRETAREQFAVVFGADALRASPAEIESVEAEYGVQPLSLAYLTRQARGVSWQRLHEMATELDRTVERVDSLEATVSSHESEIRRLKQQFYRSGNLVPKVYKTVEEFEVDSLYETDTEYVEPGYEIPEEELVGSSEPERGDNAKAKLLQELRQDEPMVVFVHGESGIGKSRLMVEVGRKLRDADEREVYYLDSPNIERPIPSTLSSDAVLFVDEVKRGEEASHYFGLASETNRHEDTREHTVQVVAAARSVYEDSLGENALTAVPEGVRERKLTVTSLDEAETKDLLSDVALSEDEVESISRSVDGNPFLARILALGEDDVDDDRPSPERKFRKVVEKRILRETNVLEDWNTRQDLEELLEVIAVLGEYSWKDNSWLEGIINTEPEFPQQNLLNALEDSNYLRRIDEEADPFESDYTHTYDPIAHFLQWRVLSDRPRQYERLVQKGLEAHPVAITDALVRLRTSTLSRFEFFDDREMADKTQTLLETITSEILDANVSPREAFAVEARIALAIPSLIPFEKLEAFYSELQPSDVPAKEISMLSSTLYRYGSDSLNKLQSEKHDLSIELVANLYGEGVTWLEKLEELADTRSDDPDFRVSFAKLLNNAVGREGEARMFEATQKRLDRLEKLVAVNPQDNAMRHYLAMALVNATADEGEAGKFESMQERINRLEELVATEMEDDAIRQELATALFNAILWEGEAGRFQDMQKNLNRLEELVITHPDDQAIRQEFADALSNVTGLEGKAGKIEAMRERLGQLENLFNTNSGDDTVRKELAAALVNAASAEGGARNIEAMQNHLNRFEELVDTYPGDATVRERWAVALVNVTNFWGKAGEFQAMRNRLGCLETLADTHPEDSTVRQVLAEALVNATNLEGETGNFEAVQQRLDLLENLVDSYPKDEKVRQRLAQALVNATAREGMAGKLEIMEARLDRLEQLVDANSDAATIRERLAKALVNAARAEGEEGELEAMRSKLDRLAELVNSYPKNTAIRERLLKAFIIVNTTLIEVGAFEELEQSVTLLEGIAASNDFETVDSPKRYEEAWTNIILRLIDAGEHDYWKRCATALRLLLPESHFMSFSSTVQVQVDQHLSKGETSMGTYRTVVEFFEGLENR